MTYFTDNLTREEDEIREEMRKQNAKWGEQNHPDGTGPDVVWAYMGPASFVAESAKKTCAHMAEVGHLTWRDILTEEIAEAYAETDPNLLDEELKQAEAVIRQWRLAIRRRPDQVNPEPAAEEKIRLDRMAHLGVFDGTPISHPDWNNGEPVTLIEIATGEDEPLPEGRVRVMYGVNGPEDESEYVNVTAAADTLVALVTPV